MFQQWIQMENFYFYQFPILVGGMIIMAMIFLIFIFHLKKRFSRIMVTSSLLIGLGLGLYTYSQYQKHLDHINQLQFVDASTRDYEKKIFADYDYSVNEKNSYRSYYNKSVMDQLKLYEPVELQENIEFIGTIGNRYGIKIGTHLYNVSKRSVKFVENLSHPQRLGIQYKLIDPQFESIGFVRVTQPLLLEFQVPAIYKQKQLGDYNENDFIVDFEIVEGWILP